MNGYSVTLNLPALVTIGSLLLVVVLLAAVIHRMTESSHKTAMRTLSNTAASWRQISMEAVLRLEDAANERRRLLGMEPFERVDPVEPEHSSPTTPEQVADAEIATMRARLIAAARQLSQNPARPEGL